MNAIAIFQPPDMKGNDENNHADITLSLMLYSIGIIMIMSSFIKDGDIIERVAAFSIGCILIVQGYMP